MTKTQQKLIERIKGQHGSGSAKEGWFKSGNKIRIQKFSEIDQAYNLAEKHPEKFVTRTLAFKLVELEMIA